MKYNTKILICCILVILLIFPVYAGNITIIGRTNSAPVLREVVSNGYLYIGGHAPILKVYDVSTESKRLAMDTTTDFEMEISSIPLENNVNYILLDGTDIFVATDFRLYIFDISTPGSPVLRGSASTIEIYTNYGLASKDTHGSLAIYGDYLYGSLGEHGYAIFDISDRDDPIYLKRIMTNTANGVATSSDGYLIFSGPSAFQPNTPGITIQSLLSDPTTPTTLSQINYTSGGDVCRNDGGLESIGDIIANGTTIYLLSYHCGVYSIGFSDPVHPVQLDNLTKPKPEDPENSFNAAKMHMGNSGLLYVSTRYATLKILNVSTPSNIVEVSSNLTSYGYMEDIYPSEDEKYVILAADTNGIVIANTTIKSDPIDVARMAAVQGGVRGIDVIDNYFVMGGHNVGVYIANTTDKLNPKTMGLAAMGGRTTGIANDGIYVYTAPIWHGMDVLNVTLNPVSPDLIYRDPGAGSPTSILRVSSNIFYTQEQIWNTTTPSSPTYKLWYPGVSYQGDLAMSKLNSSILLTTFNGAPAVGYNKGIFAYDVSDPWNPIQVGYGMNGSGFYSIVGNGTKLIAADSYGVYTFDISGGVTGNLTSKLKQTVETYYGCNYMVIDPNDSNRLYCSRSAPSSYAFKEYDITDINNIRLISTLPASFGGGSLVYSNGYLYTGVERSDGVILSTFSTKLNQPPVLTSIGRKNIAPNILTSFAITATDDDGDSMVYNATGLPAGATFTPSTRTFSWTPSSGQIGIHNATFYVNDTYDNMDSEKVYFNVSSDFATITSIRYNISRNDAILYRTTTNASFSSVSTGAGTTMINDSISLYARAETDSIVDEFIRSRIIILPVDLTMLPMNATPTNVTVMVYGYDKDSTFGANKSLIITYANTTNKSVPVESDYQNIDRIAIAPNLSYSGFNSAGWNGYILTNKSLIKPGNWTNFALMESWHFNKSFELGLWKSLSTDTMTILSADYTTDTNKIPYVIIEYTQPDMPKAPVANFDGIPTSGSDPLSVSFTDLSTNTPTSWNWTFGNSNYSSIQNPTFNFDGVGTYTVTLNVTNDIGYNISTKVNYITVSAGGGEGPEEPDPISPVSTFTINPINGFSPLSVTFTDTSSNTPTSWLWGIKNVTGNNTWLTLSTTQTFIQSMGTGNWSVNLTVSNIAGSNTSSQETYINITPPAPISSFTSNQTSGTAPLFIIFNDTSTNNPDTWLWDFGDGTFDFTQNTTHWYNTTSHWTVTLTSSNPYGSNASTQYISTDGSTSTASSRRNIPIDIQSFIGIGMIILISVTVIAGVYKYIDKTE